MSMSWPDPLSSPGHTRSTSGLRVGMQAITMAMLISIMAQKMMYKADKVGALEDWFFLMK